MTTKLHVVASRFGDDDSEGGSAGWTVDVDRFVAEYSIPAALANRLRLLKRGEMVKLRRKDREVLLITKAGFA